MSNSSTAGKKDSAFAELGLARTVQAMRQLRLHIHRGISYLAAPNKIRSISDLTALAVSP